MIKAVIFDVDGVLVDSFEANFKYFRDLFVSFGIAGFSRRKYRLLFPRPRVEVIKTIMPHATRKELNKVWQVSEKIEDYSSAYRIPDDCKKTLTHLKKSYKLGLVTNRIKNDLAEVLDQFNLRQYFTVKIVFGQVQRPKPYPDSLLLALEKLKVSHNQVVYIGDTAIDAQAAKRAKVRFIAFNKKPLPGVKYQARSFKELERLLENFNSYNS